MPGPGYAPGAPPPMAGYAPMASPAAPVRKSSAGKIVLVIVGVVLFLGLLGIGGVVYAVYKAKQKLDTVRQEYGLTDDSAVESNGTPSFVPSKGSGCARLQGLEAARILGVAVDRVEFNPKGPDASEQCDYWVNAAERRKLVKAEIAAGVRAVKKDGTVSTEHAERLVGGALDGVIEANGENKDSDSAFSLQVWRSNGRAMWEKMADAKTRANNATGGAVDLATQPVTGIGDKATVLAAGHSMMVLKGDQLFLIAFRQFVPGRDKTTALARVVVGRL